MAVAAAMAVEDDIADPDFAGQLLRVSGFDFPLRAVQLRCYVQDEQLDAELLAIAVLELSKHDRGGDAAQRDRLANRRDSSQSWSVAQSLCVQSLSNGAILSR